MLAVVMSAASPARAAGGHFEVDDALLLDPGRCQVETWALHAPRPRVTLLHVAPSCRVGDVELGVGVDRWRDEGSAREALGGSLKWATPFADSGWSAGIVAGATRDVRHDGGWVAGAYLPATYRVTKGLMVHANAGADRARATATRRRLGAAVEWAASEQVTFIAERIEVLRTRTTRTGARVALASAASLDVSAARAASAEGRSTLYGVGLNVEFGR